MSFPLDADGVWCEIRRRPPGGAALFLDRDGVVVEDTEYLHRVQDIVVIEAAGRVIAAANAAAVPVILVTNQGGIGCGFYGWAEFAAVQAAILEQLSAHGAEVDAVYAAPHHPQGRGDWRHDDHPARKPNPGMLLRAQAEFGLDLAASWLVGDKRSDIAAAQRAGLAGALHVLTGHGQPERPLIAAMAKPGFDLRLGRSIADACDLPIMRRAAP